MAQRVLVNGASLDWRQKSNRMLPRRELSPLLFKTFFYNWNAKLNKVLIKYLLDDNKFGWDAFIPPNLEMKFK